MNRLNIKDVKYPGSLKEIKKPPENLYYKGDIGLLNKTCIAIVGSRYCSDYGEKMARKFGGELSEIGIVVVSGMAKGIDSYAHEGVLEKQGRTIAVLPCGFDHVFPKSNIKLYNKIISSGGLVLSEYSPNEKAVHERFLARNRIISGLSKAIIVVEAGYRSGTTVTAKLGKEQKRGVFCIPSNLDSKTGIGTNKMIKEGANLLSSIADIIDYCNLDADTIKEQDEEKRVIRKEFQNVYNAIGYNSTYIEQVLEQVDESPADVSFKMTMLEMKGYIVSMPGGYYKRI